MEQRRLRHVRAISESDTLIDLRFAERLKSQITRPLFEHLLHDGIDIQRIYNISDIIDTPKKALFS